MTSCLSSSVLQTIEVTDWPCATLRDFMEELHAHADVLQCYLENNGTTLSSIIARLSNKYATIVRICTTQLITEALQCCLCIGAMEACTVIIKRILAVDLVTAQYVNTVLVPFIPELRRLSLEYSMLDGFSPAFQSIMLAWIGKVLGPRPSNDASTELAGLRSWLCKCKECSSVCTFLKAKPDRSMSLELIGAPRRKHVEESLRRCASSACSWNTITTSPQGLHVSLNDLVRDSKSHDCCRSSSRTPSMNLFDGNLTDAEDAKSSKRSATTTRI